MKRFLVTAVAIAALVASAGVSLAAWDGSGSGSGTSKAKSMPGGNKPDAVVSGTDVTVSWTASKFTGNINVAGYVVKRYATSSSTAITPNADCAGTIAALTCTEHSVPAGSWQYTVTPKQGNNWVGAESTKSTAVTVDTTAPQLTTLEMFDNTTNTAAELGVIDQVVATFNETLAACPGNPTTGWTVSNVPSGRTLMSVVVSGQTATLNFTGGDGSKNTAVGSFTVALSNTSCIQDASGNRSSFAAIAPADKAQPIAVDIQGTSSPNGVPASGDTLTYTFSEAMSPGSILTGWTGSSTTVSVLITDGSGGTRDTVTVTGTNLGSLNTGRTDYISGGTVTFATSSMAMSGATITVTLGGTCTGGTCGVPPAGTTGVLGMTWTPNTSATDTASPANAIRSNAASESGGNDRDF